MAIISVCSALVNVSAILPVTTETCVASTGEGSLSISAGSIIMAAVIEVSVCYTFVNIQTVCPVALKTNIALARETSFIICTCSIVVAIICISCALIYVSAIFPVTRIPCVASTGE